MLALRWSEINFEQRYLQVRRTIRCLKGRGLVESEPKTASSRRKITLSPLLLDVLKEHRVRQVQARLQAGDAWNERDLVFCTPTGGLIYPSSLRATFARLLKDAGLPHLRFHDLRHSAATLLLSMGVHAKVVQELLGHSTIAMTLNTYSHVLPSMHQDAIEKLSELFIEEKDER